MITKKGKPIRIWLIALLVAVLGFGIYLAVSSAISHQMGKLATMSADEMIAYTTSDNDAARITVGIIEGGKSTYTVYGSNATILPSQQHIYEIGSLTKTMTAALVCRAIDDGLVVLDAPIDRYLTLPEKLHYPTIEQLVTHTSGYKAHYFDWQMAANRLRREENDFYGIPADGIPAVLTKAVVDDTEHGFQYSNFGFAVLGSVMSQVYDRPFVPLMNDFLQQDLGLVHTRISDGTGDLDGYWGWEADDAYLAAGAVTSTIGDMMQYVQRQLSADPAYLARGQRVVAQLNATSAQYEAMNIRVDAAAIGWMVDERNGFLWHNGATTQFNSYAAFDREKQLGVVILSNLPPDYRIPATIIGPAILLALQGN